MDEKKRIPILDVIRGICIILMIIYHYCYSIVAFGFFPKALWLYSAFRFFDTPVYTALWLITLCGFFGVAGVVSNFSKSNFKRSLPVLAVAFIITAVTVLFLPEQAICFGVLHCMGFCMLVYAILEKCCQKFFSKVPASLFLLLFLIFYVLTETIPPIEEVKLTVFGATFSLPLFIFGFYSDSFFSADYYPIFPWLFLFLAGVRAGEYIKRGKLPESFYRADVKFLSFVGRYPLIIYATHVPIIVGILYLLNLIL